MPRGRPKTATRTIAAALLLGATLVVASGCGSNPTAPDRPTGIPSQHAALPPAQNLPDFMRGTIHEQAILVDTEPMIVSGFGMVVGLRGTGDTTVPIAVREYIIRDMVKRGIKDTQRILADKRVAIVQVEGSLPPGIKAGEQFDVQVSALAQSHVTSLTHGQLYLTELSPNGANLLSPGNPVHKYARAQGGIFVNPGYALESAESSRAAANSLRMGAILNGGQALQGRPLRLRLRQPQASMARAIERRIDERFQDRGIAAAKDDAIVQFLVPQQYQGDWEHYANVVSHLYIDASPQKVAYHAQRLAEAAVKPDAPLLDISYCWEGLGKAAAPAIQPLLTHPSQDVAYAAARAGAFINDDASLVALLQIAQNDSNPFQLSAVQSLGKLPNSPRLAAMLRKLLNSEQMLVRIEAYRTLARHKDPAIHSRVINERFVLDVVPGEGPPLIYASRSGIPRIAVIGSKTQLNMPVLYTAMGNQFMISSTPEKMLTLYYRGSELPQPVRILSRPDAAEVIARLGGEGTEGENRLDFSYSEILAVLQGLIDQKQLVASTTGNRLPAMLVLQDVSHVQDAVYAAPVIQQARRDTDSTSADDLPMLQSDVTDDAQMINDGLLSRPQ